MDSIKSEDFFKQVSLNSGVSDLKLIKDIYYGMVRTMSRELKGRQKIKLPDWGEFALKLHKARNFVSVNGVPGALPAKALVKFVPDRKVKAYFYSLGDEGL